MGLFSDLKVLYHLTMKPIRGKDHASRMESFYGGQAEAYDNFRKRLLKGREELWQLLDVPEGGVWVDMGGGTGANLENLGDNIGRLKKAYVVDLASSLLKVASERFAGPWLDQCRGGRGRRHHLAARRRGRRRGHLLLLPHHDPRLVCGRRERLGHAQAGRHDRGRRFLRLAQVPVRGFTRHGWLTRSFWPVWFASDNVFPSTDHVPFLHRRFEPVHFREHRGKVPYFPLLRMPYYVFVGRKPA